MIWVKTPAFNKLTNYSFEIRFVKITQKFSDENVLWNIKLKRY